MLILKELTLHKNGATIVLFAGGGMGRWTEATVLTTDISILQGIIETAAGQEKRTAGILRDASKDLVRERRGKADSSLSSE